MRSEPEVLIGWFRGRCSRKSCRSSHGCGHHPREHEGTGSDDATGTTAEVRLDERNITRVQRLSAFNWPFPTARSVRHEVPVAQDA
jgi:hypothetical protein